MVSRIVWISLLCFLHEWPPLKAQEFWNENLQEFSAGKDEKALFPNIFNLATNSEISATSTCGRNGPEEYCKLTEHVYLRRPQCDVCNAHDTYKQHPIRFAIDGTRNWWQSPTLSNGLSYEKVNITIDLRQEFQVAYVIIKAGISPRPGTWVLEKSLDGINYSPWQYYARSDPECQSMFNVPASVGVPKFEKDDEVICTSYYSKLDPMERGEIHTSLVNGRPSAEHPSAELQAFTRARFVRLRLLSLRTMNADLMIINRQQTGGIDKLDDSVTRRYFYSISDISIGGQCICNGHAEHCNVNLDSTDANANLCDCRHNTYGPSCSQCLPLYNQLPWRPGTHYEPNVCEACQCFNHADRCEYDEEVNRQQLSVTPEGKHEGGGRCIDCKHNTVGINCEKCANEFYRPVNVSHYSQDACRPCQCDPLGSENNQCVQDATPAPEGLSPGDCICKAGFGGRHCNRCAPGFRGYPNCEPCPCNAAGSRNFETCEESACICKDNVEGEFCNTCKPGTIYLSKDNPQGCQPCFCFGKSNECTEGKWSTSVLSTYDNWNLTDLYGKVSTARNSNSTSTLLFNSEDYPRDQIWYYWKAPTDFLSNRLSSYGSNFHYYVYYVPSQRQGSSVPVADLVLEGNGLRIEYYSHINFFPRENISVIVPFKTNSGWFNAETRRSINKVDLMRVLANVNNFYVRAKYHQDQVQSSIYGLRLELAVKADDDTSIDVIVPTLNRKHPIEMCTCPENFKGHSCETCETGYRRVANQLYGGQCEKCNCEGHSEECDAFTGHCINCQHQTTGPRCEQCLPGHYGNPSLGGVLGSCKPCACPTAENSHATSCALSQLVLDGGAAVDEDEYVCVCQPGFDGNKCEICADGYFGDPSDANSTCESCQCNDNIDSMAIGNCDRKTGVCLRCVGNTAGDHCEHCADNFWGSAMQHDCRPCNCHHLGAVASQCNNQTGLCDCVEGYTGPQCNRCAPGHGDVEAYCPSCACSSIGAQNLECDEVSGQCECKKGVYGKNCDLCIPGYYRFSVEGCEYCNCYELGAVTGQQCNNVTGMCQCQENVEGKQCESCRSGYFNITSGQGCQACQCDPIGSEDETCNLMTGQCRCKPGVTGVKCNKCAPQHYGLSETGCKQCRVCPAPGQVCDSVTGECVCPPNTVGEICQSCAKNAWNYHPLKGCELCDCNGIGADDSSECDARTGQCKCKLSYTGRTCDLCQAGFFNFPNCEPCQCDLAGTDPSQCRDGTCLCTNEGQCKCKKNVDGTKCDQCAANSFSLEKHNPFGCTECFCFNRTEFCVQHNLVWSQVYAPDRRVRFDKPFEYFNRRHNIHILKSEPLNYNSYPTNYTPLYWPLPASFTGDRTSSYNGFIRFRIANDDNYRGVKNVRPEPSSFYLFPQVLLVGNHRLELEHVPVEISLNGHYKVRLHETQWRNRLAPQIPVSRKQLMVALQNVQGVYIRGTYNEMYSGDEISIQEVSLDLSVEDSAVSNNATALGIESCGDCPEGYAGLSCQNAIQGYCRKRPHGYLNDPDDLALVGVSEKCSCNSHSTECDTETCRCMDCEHNTVGEFCEHCKPGYYGDAKSGQVDSCRKCACPDIENSFSSTCVATLDDVHGEYYCDNCRPEYAGRFCELCRPGYYGNPTIKGGLCQPCSCHPFGSLHTTCNNVTGQCDCQPGVTGRDCSACSPRHAFINRVCTSCDQGCFKDLMFLEDEMEEQLRSAEKISNTKPIPRKRLHRINTTATSLNELLDTIKSSEDDAHALVDGIDQENRYVKQAKIVEQEFQVLKDRNLDSADRINEQKEQLVALRKTLKEQNQTVTDVVNQLARFSYDIGSQTPATGEVDYLISEADAYLKSARDRNELLEKQYNYAKKNAEDAEDLLKRVLAKKLNDISYNSLLEAEKKHRQLARDYRNAIWNHARSNITTANKLTETVGKQLQTLTNTIDQIQDIKSQLNNELSTAKGNVDDLKALLQDIHNNYQTIADKSLPELRNQHEQLLELLQKHKNENHYQTLEKAEEHAKKLEHEAHRIKHAFSETQHSSSNALSASKAYAEITDALKNASAAAERAQTSANQAQNLVDRSSTDSTVNLANATLQVSYNLEKTVLDAEDKDEYAVKTNKQLNATLNRLKQLELKGNENVTRIKEAQNILEDHNDRINNIFTIVDDAHHEVGNVEGIVSEFSGKVATLADNVEAINNFNTRNINDQITNLTLSKSNVDNMVRSLQDVKSRAITHDSQIKNIHRELSLLKEKINEAREKASKIKIAVRAEPEENCYREYVSPLNPSPSNTISLKYRPALDSPDSLIFFTATQGTRTQSREYIAVELKAKKIHVRYNIGAGRRDATITKRNIAYIPVSDRYTWYQIDITRNGNTIRVSVVQKRVTGGDGAKDLDEPTNVAVGEPDVTGDLIFNTVPGQTRIHVGHSNPQITQELDLATNKFNGILGEMVLDGVNIPLWVFDSSSGNCDGASGPPALASIGHMFRNGFAQVRMPINERSNEMITITLSAYSTNGLLYFRGSPETRDFLAIQMEDGAIAVKARIASVIKINLRSNRTDYADGRVHKIRTIRKDEEVHLQIDEDDKVSTVVQKLSDNAQSEHTLNISNGDHYVGGLPPDFNRGLFVDDGIRFDGFFGCIQSVRPTQVSELDLANPVRSQRKEAGCKFIDERLTPRDRVIGFSRPGYLFTKGIQLTHESSFSFNLRTKNLNAMLLYQAENLRDKRRRVRDAEEDPTFVAFYLFGGRLVAHLGTDSHQRLKRPSLISEQAYNDGQLHSVFLARDESQVLVRIDDREIITATLEDETTIGNERSIMLLGGFPRQEDWPEAQQDELGTSESLIGCLSDFYLNYKKFPIIPDEHLATLGACDLEHLDISDNKTDSTAEEIPSLGRRHQLTLTVEKPLDIELEDDVDNYQHAGHHIARSAATCSAVPSLTSKAAIDGARFGVSESSHSRLNFEQPYPDFNTFKINFGIKTTQKNGLIWTWANYKNYTRYFFLTLERGFLKLEVKGHREPKFMRYRHLRINNNEWHQVELKKEGRNLWLQVDELKREIMRDTPNPKVMKKRMFVGGVISKHRRQFKIPQRGFQGCLKQFLVNDIEQDLVGKSRDVMSCSHNPNTDYIFAGGYISFDSLSKLGHGSENSEVAFDFKPNNIQGALLLGIFSPEDYQTTRLLLYIADGELVLNVVMDYKVSVKQKLGLSVCAGEWHRLNVKLTKNSAHVQLNDQRIRVQMALDQDNLNELRLQQVHLGSPTAFLLNLVNATSFDGCVRNIQLDGTVVMLNKAKRQNKVIPFGCPN